MIIGKTTSVISRILHLTLHRVWFDLIATGKKKTEFRLNKPYWRNRIFGKKFDEVHFTNGYGKHRPFMRIQYKGYSYNDDEIAIKLGEILELRNYSGAKSDSDQ